MSALRHAVAPPALCQAGAPEGAIDAALESLHKSLLELTTRLEPVLTPGPPSAPQEPSPHSRVLGAIQEMDRSVGLVLSRLDV